MEAALVLNQYVADSRSSLDDLAELESERQAKGRRLADHTDGDPSPRLLLELGLSEETTLDVDVETLKTFLAAQHHHRNRQLARYPQMLLNTAFIYLVALFDAFASDALTLTLIARPGMMKSQREIKLEDVIKLHQAGELIEHLARREAVGMSFKSFKDQAAEYRKRFQAEIVPGDVPESRVVEASARRNLLVHNGGIVNDIYLGMVGHGGAQLGERVDIDETYWNGRFSDIAAVADNLRTVLSAKVPAGDPSAGWSVGQN